MKAFLASWMARARSGAIQAFIVFSFVPLIYQNFIEASDLPYVDAPLIKQLRTWYRATPLRLTDSLMGLQTRWRMYSPCWKYFPWFEWYARDGQGEWVAIETRNLSPEYVMRRDWASTLLWDAKLGMLQTALTQTPEYRAAFARYMCGQVRAERGWAPAAMRLIERGKNIPPPERKGSWTPVKGPVDYERQWEFACS